MKAFGFWVLLLLVGAALMMCLISFSGVASTSTGPGMPLSSHVNDITVPTINRKLKENSNTRSSYKGDTGNVNLDDYHPIDPVPSSKASIRPGPIQHGTPLMPYIPKPSPPGPSPTGPGHPKHVDFP